MEEIIKAFGIDGRLIVIQIVNFSVLVGLLGYFLYNPILRVLRDREEKIAQGIKDAEAAAVAKATADAEKQVVLTAAHQEASEINTRAKAAADVKSDEIVSAAEEKAAATLKAAERKATEAAARITKEAEAEIAKTAILAAEKVLREQAA
jgi:F-type H+-transporting ATPase subunit b